METFRKQSTLKPYFENSYGCAVFNSVAKGGIFFVGGAYGKGDIYKFSNKGETQEIVGKVDLIQAMAGWVMGGEVYSEIVFFESEGDFNKFTAGNFEFSADAKAVALTAAASTKATTMGNQGVKIGLNADDTVVYREGATIEYTKGMKVFTLTLGGLMYQATVGGQKFNVKMGA